MRIIATLFLVVGYFAGFSQTDTTFVPFVSYWAKGDSYNFKITKINQQWESDEIVKDDTSSYLANFLVLDSTETSYTIQWSYKNQLSDYNIPEDLMDRFAQYENIDVIYKTSEVGDFTGIENWEEISISMRGMFGELIDFMVETNDIDRATFESQMAPMIQVFESKQGIEQIVFKELYFMHFLFGLQYSVEEPIKYEEFLPNLFGGDPIKGDSKLYVEEVDFENDYCVMRKEMRLDPTDSKNMIIDFFKKMGVEDKEMKKAMKKAKMEINDAHRFEYYFYPGVPISIEAKRQTNLEMGPTKVRKIEKTILELVD